MIKHKSINYIHLTTVPSTNLWVKENASILDPNKLTCVTAEEQTAGKGTQTKKWVSPKGLNIYVTLYFTLPKGYPYLHNLAQIFSIAACRVIENLGFQPQIKWPNDLFLEKKKFAGVLCETTPVGEKTGIALGLGLNVNMPKELNQKIDQPATSLLEISQKNWDLDEILDKIIEFFLEDLETLSLKGFSAFISYYNERLAFRGQCVQIKEGTGTQTGVFLGVSPEGLLLLENDNGKQVKFSSGKILPYS